jgi:hypothetical protein
MGKTIRKFSKKRKQTQNKRKTKGRKPIRRKSVRHGRKRGGNTEFPYKDMKPAYDVRFEVERAAKALDDTDKVKGILKKLSSDGKGSCISVNKTTIETVHRYIQDLYPNKDPEYSDAEKACELLKQKQYFKASILGQLIDLEENIMEKIKKKIKRKGIYESIDSETKKQAYAELIFIRMYTLILKKIKTKYDCRNIYRNKYNELKDRFSYEQAKQKPKITEMPTMDEIIEKYIINIKEHEDCESIYQNMKDNIGKDDKENEVISFNADEIEVGDVEELKDTDNRLQQLKHLFHGELNMELGESEINKYFNTLFDNAFFLAKQNMIKVQKYDSTIQSREVQDRGYSSTIEIIDTYTPIQKRSEILDNNMQITHLTPTDNSVEIYEKEDGTYGLRPIPNQPPNSEI